ncbi:hypothetical protein F4775DRAFT_573377 [Biscogniauxia sp. FL1348]|nr:hypothetical protein F4775DRAFT_573377 [Biscogniauxia sp. FL1348]
MDNRPHDHDHDHGHALGHDHHHHHPEPAAQLTHSFSERRQHPSLRSDSDNIMDGASASAPASASGTTRFQSHDTAVDPDTCRICRGEGTPEEPLFYPCKCSGSIKFVHQDCLMEWLSHSQKKHCELCKTPFRFTKLYSPNMPKRLPYHVFISHMTKYMFRNMLVWMRAALVASVWLGWLPYLMRSVWSFLFWISDDGFGPGPHGLDARNATASMRTAADMTSLSLTGTTTCPSTPLLAATTTVASIGGVIDHIPVSNLLKAISKPLNMSATQSWLRMLLGMTTTTEGSALSPLSNVNITHLDKTVISTVHNSHPSLLSEVAILKNLTRNPTINRTIIAVLEGQIITLLVIVCFILIILVRDYVVQQQPEINMRAAFAAPNPLPAEPLDLDLVPHMRVHEDHDQAGDDSDSSSDMAVDGDDDRQGPLDNRPVVAGPQDIRQRPIAAVRRRPARQNAPFTNDGASHRTGPEQEAIAIANAPEDSSAEDRLLNGAEDEQLRSHSGSDGEDASQSTVKEYLRIYREAGGDRDRILQMIRDEGLEYRLRYWVRVTHAMANNGRAPLNDNNIGLADLAGGSGSREERRQEQVPSMPASLQANRADSDGSSWTWADSEEGADANDASGGKGKERDETMIDSDSSKLDDVPRWSPRPGSRDSFQEEQYPVLEAPALAPSYTRPRSVSDGPQVYNSINPLANNSWSFSNLPSDDIVGESSASAGLSQVSQSNQPNPASLDLPSNPDPVAALPSAPVNGDAPTEREDGHQPHTGIVPLQGNINREPDSLQPDNGAADEPYPNTFYRGERDQNGNPVVAGARVQDIGRAANAIAQRQGGIVDRVADFMWGDVNPGQVDALPQEPVDIFGDNQNAPFMDVDRDGDVNDDDEVEMAPDVVEAAVAAGLDPEAIDDAEDFEGIMELIGMRGPVAGLFQNAIFCAFLVSISIFLGVFLPYNIGRITVWTLANPTRIIRMAFSFAKFLQDGALFVAGCVSHFVFKVFNNTREFVGIDYGRQTMNALMTNARELGVGALDRIATSFMSEVPILSASEMRNFSVISHEALIFFKDHIRNAVIAFGRLVAYLLGGNYGAKLVMMKAFVTSAPPVILEMAKAVPRIILQPNSWKISLNLPETSFTADSGLAYWDANDRTWAILLGYLSISFLAALYLGRGAPFSTGQTAQEWEASIIDALNQASGVMKVILIISIEMLIFPLYCGLLLDFALLPLFENTSFKSRLLFTYHYPLTSIFVHWFVGTGYMFHFALFVSMCRKIMRKGVLYFIRDPDDPEFHPVRDVLERNVTTQLRKILFSAFVYGALVVICLGGVVWGLSITLPNVLPIHYSSNEPVLEFPIDLLFYNFLMPLAVRFFKPSDGLHAMYTWWFRKCARALRLTWFLFGERRVDEEGTLALPAHSPYHNLPWWRKVFLEVNSQNEVVPKTWHDTFDGGRAKPTSKISPDDMIRHNENKAALVSSGQLITNGRFVRSPASDQVKIPKGQAVFLNVSEQDIRPDGKVDRQEADFYSGSHYQSVYVPPWFRVRVFLFILSIWIFAAVTGVGVTIVPLVFGRRMFKVLIPSHIRTNDIYAFSIGIYILGSLTYFAFHIRSMLNQLRNWCSSAVNSMFDRHALKRGVRLLHHASQLVYTYVVLLVVFPLLITLLVELYLLMPLHTYMYPMGVGGTTRLGGLQEAHTIRVIQAWTLGILYLKLGSRALTLYGGRPAQAVRAVLRRGWLEPDVGVLTRAFVIPGVTASLAMIFTPPILAWLFISRGVTGTPHLPPGMQVLIFRLAYPLTALFWACLLMIRNMVRVFETWQVRIRDEAYLMGERLHNFGGTASKGSVWRGSTRL